MIGKLQIKPISNDIFFNYTIKEKITERESLVILYFFSKFNWRFGEIIKYYLQKAL